ncbi:MAG: gamma-glutamyltranspeptidase/glutathione hydrolase [Gammaproteobacteria bacterium]
MESGFGSRLMSGGFLLNNELTDFSALPEKDGVPVANRIEPGKRPRSSMAPTMIFSPDGNLFMVIGSSGGSRIINYVVKTIVAVIDFEQDIQSAIASPNFSNRNGPTDLEEESIASQWQKKLMTLGHEVEVKNLNSGLHGILRQPDGSLAGGADPRREGIVLGD